MGSLDDFFFKVVFIFVLKLSQLIMYAHYGLSFYADVSVTRECGNIKTNYKHKRDSQTELSTLHSPKK